MSYRNSATIAESQILSPRRLWESERIELRAPALNFPHLQGGFPLLQGRIGGAGRREGRAVPQFRGRKEVPVQARGRCFDSRHLMQPAQKLSQINFLFPPSPEMCSKRCALYLILEVMDTCVPENTFAEITSQWKQFQVLQYCHFYIIFQWILLTLLQMTIQSGLSHSGKFGPFKWRQGVIDHLAHWLMAASEK